MKINMKFTIGFLMISYSVFSHSAWLNVSGKVTQINFYANTSTVLVSLSNSGTKVKNCSNDSAFAIDGNLPLDRRQQMVSAILAADASQSLISFAYSDVECVGYEANPKAYRYIKRIIK